MYRIKKGEHTFSNWGDVIYISHQRYRERPKEDYVGFITNNTPQTRSMNLKNGKEQRKLLEKIYKRFSTWLGGQFSMLGTEKIIYSHFKTGGVSLVYITEYNRNFHARKL